jgi:Asp-tRNA(Asn)/Glu-tRNA(Gln) amidotransferase A subunit family amidase
VSRPQPLAPRKDFLSPGISCTYVIRLPQGVNADKSTVENRMPPLDELTSTEAATAIAAGTLTSEALVSACLERITAQEARIGAWEYLDPEQALAQARARDRRPVQGPLHGVPVGIKDLIDTADMPTSYGSPIYAGYQPRWDAACVALLRAAGAVILGKTVTTEFAMFTPGKTTNPHNSAHTPGGSSSGSAAAVAACMVPLALGTQTAGSIIRPASYCGVVGYKPTYGQFSVAGIKALSQTLDTLGGMARSVADLALLRAAMVGSPPRLPTLDRAPRLGLCRTPQWPQATAATQAALEAAGRQLAAAGARVQELELPAEFEALVAAQETIQVFEGARCFAYELAQHRERLSPKLLELLAPAEHLTYAAYAEALALANTCRGRLGAIFADHDALLVPSAPGEAPPGLEATGNPLFNRMWTLLHTPAVTLPGYTGPTHLPVGVQVVGLPGMDDHLLAIAAWIHPRLV